MSGLLFEPAAATADIVGYAEVAPEQGIDLVDRGLTYAVPRALADLGVGERVVIPLGRSDKAVAGYVLGRWEALPEGAASLARVKPIWRRDERGLSLTADLMELAKWMAGYYCCPLGMVLVTMLPAAVKRGTGRLRRVLVSLAENAKEKQGQRLSTIQRKVLAIAAERTGARRWVEMKELADLAGARTVGPVKGLVAKGWLVTRDQDSVRAAGQLPFEVSQAMPRSEAVELSGDQSRALDGIAASIGQGFSVHLLHGVTGSGKTEVYLRVIERVMAQGSGAAAMVLVPEIALTPQTAGRFVGRFGERVAVLHSGLTDAQRNQQWQRIRSGAASIVVGARSAVFAPLSFRAGSRPGAGVIIVDEEHDASYKQDQLPRYHGRDVAIKRGQILGIPVILGSATPSLESYYNATVGERRHYVLHRLPQRVAGLKLPRVEIVDLQEERRAGRGIFSRRLEQAMGQTLGSGGQVMLLLNRRGFANYIACADRRCGWLMSCEYCDALVVYHKVGARGPGPRLRNGREGLVRCHHCGAEQLLARACPLCGKTVVVFGLGTQRVEEEVARRFAGVSCQRMDADTMRSGRDYEQSLAGFRRGEVKILLGTQMIAKGLDFPNVRLVGVLSADTALHLPDFRAAERTFQLVAQVAGRAGRGHEGGVVIVQTFNPKEAAIVLAANHDYEGFAERELAVRRAAGFPPTTRMARIVVRHRDDRKAQERAKLLGQALEARNAELGLGVRIAGPMPCVIARLAEYYRQEIQLLAADVGKLQRLLMGVRQAGLLRSDLWTAVDVDPVAMM